MKKLTFLVVAVLLTGKLLMAQDVEAGKRFLYYNRFTSAKQTLEKAVAANPKDANATYWLGQTLLSTENAAGKKDIAAAKALYQKALNEGVNDPMIWIGMGHVELLEGKKNEARQRFESAITASIKKKKEDPNILNAIGRANADGGTEIGDPAYAIEKLKRAAELDPKNPEIFVNLGINYLKAGGERSGGDAYEAFGNALRIDPKYALANFRLGKIFQSQNNKEKFEQYFIAAIENDPAFAPSYIELYNYYQNRDINKAREYLDKYIANSDKDCNTEFYYADYLFRSGKYQESLTKVKDLENGACKGFPQLKVLYAYNYDRLGDSLQAKSNIESYLNTTDPALIKPEQYMFAASVLKNIQGSEQNAITYLEKALEFDTARATRFMYMDTIASLYRKLGMMPERLTWLRKSYTTNPNPSNLDIYNIGDAAFNAGQFVLADSMFNNYKTTYPDQIYGYLGLSKTAIARDKDTTTGSAVPAVLDYINILKKTDAQRYKSQIIQNYGYLVYVHANVQKDYPAAVKDLEGILEVDPENSYAIGTIEQIKKVMNGPTKTPAKSTSSAKPKAK
jgi:tetratricopeptide (TPR) repeat protein